MCKRTGQYRMYEDMGIYQLLFSIRDNNILERIVEEQVGILIAYDQEDDSEMDHLFCTKITGSLSTVDKEI